MESRIGDTSFLVTVAMVTASVDGLPSKGGWGRHRKGCISNRLKTERENEREKEEDLNGFYV